MRILILAPNTSKNKAPTSVPIKTGSFEDFFKNHNLSVKLTAFGSQ